ncbi:MAG: hypothetical protein V4613_11055 [Bacteroidota bacterium]
MKYLVLPFLIALCYGCNDAEKKTVLQPFNLSAIPAEWVELTNTDSGYIVYESCDAGNGLITIQSKGGKYSLTLGGAQDDYVYTVVSANKGDKDTILIEGGEQETTDKQLFKMHWLDKEKGIAAWKMHYANGTSADLVFVVKQKAITFPHCEQPCAECWGEENCNENEKHGGISKSDAVAYPEE